MPPVKTAEPRIPIAPKTKPKLAPNARPPIMMMAQTGSNPATAPPSGLTAATTAVKTPNIAKHLQGQPLKLEEQLTIKELKHYQNYY
jgi:hypothetical protein